VNWLEGNPTKYWAAASQKRGVGSVGQQAHKSNYLLAYIAFIDKLFIDLNRAKQVYGK